MVLLSDVDGDILLFRLVSTMLEIRE